MLNRVQSGHDPVMDLFAMALGPEKIGLWRLTERDTSAPAQPDLSPRPVEALVAPGRGTLRGLVFVAPSTLFSLHARGELLCWRVADAAGELLEEAELVWEIKLDLKPSYFKAFADHRHPDFCLMVGGKAGKVAFIRPDRGDKPLILSAPEAHKNDITALTFSHDGRRAASAGRGRTIKIWNLKEDFARATPADTSPHAPSPALILSGFEAWTLALAFSHDATRLASGGMDDTLYLWNLAGEATQPVAAAREHHGWIADVAWAPDDSAIAAASWDNTIGIYQTAPLAKQHILRGHKDYVSNLYFLPDSGHLLSTSYDESISVWDWKGARRLQHIPAHGDWVLGLDILEGGRLATVAGDRSAAIWASDPPKRIAKLGEKSWQWSPVEDEIDASTFSVEVLSGQSADVLKSIFETSNKPTDSTQTPAQDPGTNQALEESSNISQEESSESNELPAFESLNELSDEELAAFAFLSSETAAEEQAAGPEKTPEVQPTEKTAAPIQASKAHQTDLESSENAVNAALLQFIEQAPEDFGLSPASPILEHASSESDSLELSSSPSNSASSDQPAIKDLGSRLKAKLAKRREQNKAEASPEPLEHNPPGFRLAPGAPEILSIDTENDDNISDEYEPEVSPGFGNLTRFGMPSEPAMPTSEADKTPAHLRNEAERTPHTLNKRSGTLTDGKPLGRLESPEVSAPSAEKTRSNRENIHAFNEHSSPDLSESTAPRELSLAQEFNTPVSKEVIMEAHPDEETRRISHADLASLRSGRQTLKPSADSAPHREPVRRAFELPKPQIQPGDDGKDTPAAEQPTETLAFEALLERYHAQKLPQMAIIKRQTSRSGKYQKTREFKTSHPELRALALSNDGERLATCGSNGVVEIHSLRGLLLHRLQGDQRGYHDLAITRWAGLLFAASDSGYLDAWFLPEDAEDAHSPAYHARLKEHKTALKRLAISPDNKLLLSGDSTGMICGWDLEAGMINRRYIGHEDAITGLDFQADTIISSAEDHTLRQWNQRGVLLDQLDTPTKPRSLSAGPEVYLWGDSSGSVTLRRADESTHLKPHQGEVFCVCARTGTLIASAGADGLVHIYRPGDTAPLQTLELNQEIAALTLNGDFLLVGTRSGNISLFNRRPPPQNQP